MRAYGMASFLASQAGRNLEGESPSPALLPAGGAEHKELQTPAPRPLRPTASHCCSPKRGRKALAHGWLAAGPSGKGTSAGI